MSASLAFKPVIEEDPDTLSDKLRFILTEKYDLQNGTHVLTSLDISYLEGLKDAGHAGAKVLIDNINQYDKVKIWLAY